MFKLKPILFLVAVLLIASLACALPNNAPVPTIDPNLVNTAIAQTIAAQQTQSGQGGDLESPTFTFTPESPTLTPTMTLSPTPILSPTPVIPLISVSVPTNCRVGPGSAYERVGALLVGEVAEVYGRDPTGDYWYIRNPDSGDEFCWLWGKYATLVGNTLILPVYTPPPTPTPVPSFGASFAGLDSCVGWWVEIKLENSSSIDFQSISLSVKDTVTGVVVSSVANNFTNLNGCLTSNTKNTLAAGASVTVSSPAFAYDPTGHKLRATISLCSEPSQAGLCASNVISFTP